MSKGTGRGASKGAKASAATRTGQDKATGAAQGAGAAATSAKGGPVRPPARTPARSASGGSSSAGRGAGAAAGARTGARSGVGPGGSAGAGPGAWLAKPLSPLRIGVYALLVVVGAIVGIAGALVQSAWFPGGLLLALLGFAALCVGGLYATGARAGAWSPAAGWLMMVLFLTATRAEGDFVFGSGVGSYLFLLGGMFAGVICATVPKLPQSAASATRLGK
ncbi:DUF6113 family protein [Streptomyces zagrosensis]|uniref:Integral membrane protein n=1 Tax=Streptomyces zagrosensis TaxID=1042984 RepID=A0A7W9UZ79_9ACTN|nr:DUF6113 family protein [Streptomyces zagrosensis]MBB5936750.1 hypothetical protein [Streptomyces zagrosensis]